MLIGLPCRPVLRALFAALLLMNLPLRLQAVDPVSVEEDDFPPGLRATYSTDERSVHRIDPDIAFNWRASAPDARLPAGPFTAQWTGNLLIRQPGRYRIHAWITGQITVRLGDTVVLHGTNTDPGWLHGEEFDLPFGEAGLDVQFERLRTNGEAQLSLFWSSDRFAREPIPSYLLFRDQGAPELAVIERGRQAWATHRCNRCHQRPHEPSAPPAPALTQIVDSIPFEALVRQIETPVAESSHARMPTFGFTIDEARSIAAFLLTTADSPKLKVAKLDTKSADQDLAEGIRLIQATGCLACHTLGDLGTAEPYSANDLTTIGRKRSIGWLHTWLSKPEQLNPDHRMPVFTLTSKERLQISLALSRQGTNGDQSAASTAPELTDAMIERGRQLVTAARCAACHRINDIKTNTVAVSKPFVLPDDHAGSCLSQDPDRTNWRPAYPHIDRTAIVAWLESSRGGFSPESDYDRGLRIVEQRNCLACHERGQSPGLVRTAGRLAQSVDEFKRQSEALIPPALTAVGDKLHDAALLEAVNGAQKSIRLPWLHVRMPQFRHDADDAKSIVDTFIAHDRIPADAAGLQPSPVTSDSDKSMDILVTGHALIGARGFSCIACHKVGDFEPKQVALGTRGSDLKLLGKRMRREFYLRWTRSPLRIVPGMEMPSFDRPVPDVLDARIESQLVATWDALNDPRFVAPTDPSSVEQFLVVEPDQPARIVRDVFTNPDDNGGGYVARSMAIGLNNGHSALFDLDTLTLRQWTFGDLARQRTSGKSWYWDMAGVPVMTGFSTDSDFALRDLEATQSTIIRPHAENGTNGRLTDYRNRDHGIELHYQIVFRIGERNHNLDVIETIMPFSNDRSAAQTGWTRGLQVSGIPKHHDLIILKPKAAPVSGDPAIEVSGASESIDTSPGRTGDVFRRYSNGECAITMHYASRLHRPPLKAKPPKSAPPQPVVEAVTSVPGFEGQRLRVDRSIMPTAMAWTADGVLAFTSLKGHVYFAHDTDNDGLPDQLQLFEEGLAAPYGIIADGDDLIVAHKPEVLRLSDTDGDGRADQRTVIASGWGYNDNYHDWTCGIVRDHDGNLYVGLGSDYAQPKRPKEQSRWRGSILRISSSGNVEAIAHSFRYPTGLAIDTHNRLFATDNQGVQNTFNELNHIRPGMYYGVPSRHEVNPDAVAETPAIQIPHPWSRSINGIVFLPASASAQASNDALGERSQPDGIERLESRADDGGFSKLAGHGIGCEYDSRFLIRFTLQQVGDTLQGAAYYFSHPDAGDDNNFVGPLCCATGPDGSLYIGNIHDSGWLGGRNTGAITRLTPTGDLPNGIRELRATSTGFEIEFFAPIDRDRATRTDSYTISAYRREWQGSYATPDSDRHRVETKSAIVSPDGTQVTLRVDRIQPGFVYEVTCAPIGQNPDIPLWPTTGHYTMKVVPASD